MRQLVAETPAFTVLDWFLQQFPELIDAPLDHEAFAGPDVHMM